MAKSLATQRSSCGEFGEARRRDCARSVRRAASTLRKSASAMTVALPLPDRAARDEAARRRSSHRPRATRATQSGSTPPADLAWDPVSSGASSVSPQCASKPVSAKDGGGRSLSPSGRLLGHSSRGSASRSSAAALAHPAVEIDRAPRPAAPADAPSAAAALPRATARRSCRSEPPGSGSPARSRPSTRRLERELFGEDRMAGSSAASAPARSQRGRGCRPAPRHRTERERRRAAISSSATSRRESGSRRVAAHRVLFLSLALFGGRVAARRDAELGERLVRLGLVRLRTGSDGGASSSRDRLITDPSSTRRKANARPVSPIRMR